MTVPPPEGQVATRLYRFTGTTEPGCTVTAAGRYDAPVDADGNWSIVLVLAPGHNVATFTATDPAGNATTVRHGVSWVPPRPALLIANRRGIWIDRDGQREKLLGGPVRIAFADDRGGIVFQRPQEDGPINMTWDDDLGRARHVWAEGTGPEPIMRMTDTDASPQVAVEHPDGLVRLVDVADIAGAPHVLYWLSVGSDNPEPSWWDEAFDYELHLVDLTTGSDRVLGWAPSFDGPAIGVRFGADLAVMTHTPFPEGPGRVGVVTTANMLANPEGAAITAPCGPDLECLEWGPAFDHPGDSTGWVLAAVAPNGSRFSWVGSSRGCDAPGCDEAHVVAHSGRDSRELFRTGLDDDASYAASIDDDGTWIVVTVGGPDKDDKRTYLVGPDGSADRIPGRGVATFWDDG